MGEVRFYHLTERPLDSVLPVMLEKSLERGWRVVVRGIDLERIEALTTRLWTHGDGSFLPHGSKADGNAARQPIWLGCEGDEPVNPNGANTLFLIDNAAAEAEELHKMEMVAVLFDGNDQAAVEHARAQWKAVAGAGLKAVYWAQAEGGAWVKRSETE